MINDQMEQYFVTSATLKWVALATMVVDHAATAVLDWFLVYHPQSGLSGLMGNVSVALHCIGRLAFPLYAFLLVEGFLHTRSRPRYLVRLCIFALISEVPFDLALMLWKSDMQAGIWWRFEHQNVLFTLILGFAAMWAIERALSEERQPHLVVRILLCTGAAIGCCLIASSMHADYSWQGVLAILICFLCRKTGKHAAGFIAAVAVLALYSPYELLALIDAPLIALYSGERGSMPRKQFFYWFYPVHLLVLGIVRIAFIIPW